MKGRERCLLAYSAVSFKSPQSYQTRSGILKINKIIFKEEGKQPGCDMEWSKDCIGNKLSIYKWRGSCLWNLDWDSLCPPEQECSLKVKNCSISNPRNQGWWLGTNVSLDKKGLSGLYLMRLILIAMAPLTKGTKTSWSERLNLLLPFQSCIPG